MSADYQAVMLMAMAVSLTTHEIVFKPMRQDKVMWQLMLTSLALILLGRLYIELPQAQVMILVISFAVFLGIYGAMYDCLLRPYIRGRILQYAYLAHVGFWAGLVTWSTRWII